MDYINDGDDNTDTDLGCNGIWLMPVNPSPTYHKYDVADYYNIDPAYGTLDDFKQLIEECDKRGIKVIMDLVLNHSSSQNPWFIEACDYLRALGDKEPDALECPYLEYYNFSRELVSSSYAVEGSDWYYEAQFWSEMPDLDLDSIMKIILMPLFIQITIWAEVQGIIQVINANTVIIPRYSVVVLK